MQFNCVCNIHSLETFDLKLYESKNNRNFTSFNDLYCLTARVEINTTKFIEKRIRIDWWTSAHLKNISISSFWMKQFSLRKIQQIIDISINSFEKDINIINNNKRLSFFETFFFISHNKRFFNSQLFVSDSSALFHKQFNYSTIMQK